MAAGEAENETELARVLAAATLSPPPANADRPLVVLNMVMSADGRISVGDRVRGLTGAADQALLHHLRAQADVVLVGAATVRAEGYGGLLPEELRERRVSEGRPAEPILSIVSASLDLDPALGAFNAPGLRVLVATAGASRPVPAELIDFGGSAVPIPALLSRLRSDHGAAIVVCEGGPGLAAEVIEADCLDEAFVTISPHLVGGLGRSGMTSDALRAARDLELRTARSVDGHVFLRYRVGS